MAPGERKEAEKGPRYHRNSHTDPEEYSPPPSSSSGTIQSQENNAHRPNLSAGRYVYSPSPSSLYGNAGTSLLSSELSSSDYESSVSQRFSERYVPTPISSYQSSETSTPSIYYTPWQPPSTSRPQSPVPSMGEYMPSPQNESQGYASSSASLDTSRFQGSQVSLSSTQSSSTYLDRHQYYSPSLASTEISQCYLSSTASTASSQSQESALSTHTPQFHHSAPVLQPRPTMPSHQFTQPYVATPYGHPKQTPTFSTSQFEHPFGTYPEGRHKSLDLPPQLPPRPLSAPAEPYNVLETEGPNNNLLLFSGQSTSLHHVPLSPTVTKHKDQKSPAVSRLVGNMLVVRMGRASVQTIQSTAKLPFYLSPWGDNNPVTLPNIRKRDVALAGFAHIGVSKLAPSAVSLVEHAVKYAATFAIEKSAESGFQKVHGETPAQSVKRRIGIDSITLRIKHKLIGEEAELTFFGERDAMDKTSCAKGWFCPYLYASGRTPDLARSKDFSIAQLVRPGLAADASIAPTFLSSFAETLTPVVSLCPWDISHPTFPRYRRMAICLIGLSPYRTTNTWSQSRIPNEARLSFHTFTHIPAVVVPVSDDAPVLAWSSWTVEQMMSAASQNPLWQLEEDELPPRSQLDYDPHLAYGELPTLSRRQSKGTAQKKDCGYDAGNHCREIKDFLDLVVDEALMQPESKMHWRSTVGNGVASMISSVLSTEAAIRATAAGICDLERAGIVMFRF
jgi:hypothetical protein